jgi:pimeloyl-ACP methyl ester carboxylesterase
MLTALLMSVLSLGPTPLQQDSIPSVPITLKTPTGDISGALVVGPGTARRPLVLIIAGSGPTDRDGNSSAPVAPGRTLDTDSYKQLAEALAANGIASVRYDKRGVGASAKAMSGMTEDDYRFEMGVDDAAAWIRMLRADPRFSKVVVVGHSEGSLIGMIAAQRAQADGFVSLEGAGRPAADILREQLTAAGVPPAMFQSILDSLAAGRTVDNTPPALAALFRPSVQPYMISWFKYDPAAELKKLPYPALVIQGTHDVQVSEKDAALLAAARGAKLVTIDGMTHVLKLGPADKAAQAATVYSDPGLPIAPEVVSAIVTYVRASPRAR